MAELTAKKRAKIPKQKFALPKQRAYPIPDKAHARNAKARASQMFKQGKLSESELGKVNRAADKVLYGSKKAAKKAGAQTTAGVVKKGRTTKKVETVAQRYGTRKKPGKKK